MKDKDAEIQQRVCRACSETYNYPVLKSMATRFHCEACARLDPPVRAVIEKHNKRLKVLATAVQKLEKRLAEVSSGAAEVAGGKVAAKGETSPSAGSVDAADSAAN